ncbi:MAG TPA: acyl-CoA dehydrogenase family protein [Spongiibacteraceae bacterium]|nr:acyl-CoA dehydrogenase family protein [Spongiibacteraceae bacterium]
MTTRQPITHLPTHTVSNQPPPLEDINLFELDIALRDGLQREGAAWAASQASRFGALMGNADVLKNGELANRYAPVLKTFDRFGQRIDEVEFHPAYHDMMKLGIEAGIHSIAWNNSSSTTDKGDGGGHVAHMALEYLLVQTEAGVCCPITMTYAAIPALQHQPELAALWAPKILSNHYDARMAPMAEKSGLTIGMAMTEKQGGSDVRANLSSATKVSDNEYRLTGHKWFCSAPMCDAFLTLAQAPQGLTCFLVPRWLPDGTRNNFFIQRLKDKMGNRSNASSEIEYQNTFAMPIGGEGRGVKTIIEMVHHTRLDTCLAAAGLMRQAFVQAVHHANYRSVFEKRLIEQPLMQNVLADMALESEAALLLTLRIARAYDESRTDENAAIFARMTVAIGKYWVNKRTPNLVYEAMESLGGAGYVEESMLPRLYREAPLNSIWEGSGNVICLDVLRALLRTPASGALWFDEVADVAGDPRIAPTLQKIKQLLAQPEALEAQARQLVESMALVLQASLMLRHSPTVNADAFIAARLQNHGGLAYGTLPAGTGCAGILRRAWPLIS